MMYFSYLSIKNESFTDFFFYLILHSHIYINNKGFIRTSLLDIDIERYFYIHASMQTFRIHTSCILFVESFQRNLGDR